MRSLCLPSAVVYVFVLQYVYESTLSAEWHGYVVTKNNTFSNTPVYDVVYKMSPT